VAGSSREPARRSRSRSRGHGRSRSRSRSPKGGLGAQARRDPGWRPIVEARPATSSLTVRPARWRDQSSDQALVLVEARPIGVGDRARVVTRVTEYVGVPTWATGAVIGQAGATIRRLKEVTGCGLRVVDGEDHAKAYHHGRTSASVVPGNRTSAVKLEGDPASVATARKLVQAIAARPLTHDAMAAHIEQLLAHAADRSGQSNRSRTSGRSQSQSRSRSRSQGRGRGRGRGSGWDGEDGEDLPFVSLKVESWDMALLAARREYLN
jgi:hypothetical protein